jgi:hypothetical protein
MTLVDGFLRQWVLAVIDSGLPPSGLPCVLALDSVAVEKTRGAITAPLIHRSSRPLGISSVVKIVQGFLKTVGVAPLCFGQRFKPVRYFVKTFVSRHLGHAGIHISVFVSLSRD